jgi:hypothetical protein
VRIGRRESKRTMKTRDGRREPFPRKRWRELTSALFTDEGGAQMWKIAPVWLFGVAVFAAALSWPMLRPLFDSPKPTLRKGLP